MDIRRYPKTPFAAFSPSLRASTRKRLIANAEDFVGCEVVLTEKIDGANTLIEEGLVYGRSVSAPSQEKWNALVKKHIAWKIQGPDSLYGENIYAVHSISCDAVAEAMTFMAFGLRTGDVWRSFADLEAYCAARDIATVPVLFRGRFDTVAELKRFVLARHAEESTLGGEREGVVIRRAGAFRYETFAANVCKSVREGHVRTDGHWRRTWKVCALAEAPTPVRGSGPADGTSQERR